MTKQAIQIAYVYNRRTGANITHKDVLEWGLIETEEILIALELLDVF